MPRIPTYAGQQVQSTPARINALPGVAQAGQATPDAFNDGAGFAAAGKGLLSVGNALADVVEREQQAFDEARVQDAYTRLAKANNDAVYGNGGVTSLTGAQAVGAAQKWAEGFDKTAETINSELNPRQQQLFSKHVQGLRRGFYDNVLRHEAQQGVVYREEVYKQAVGAAIDTAATSYRDPEVVDFQTNVALRALRLRPEYLGADAAVRGELERTLLATFNSAVIDAALHADDVAYASAVFKAAGKDMPLTMRVKIENRLKPATDFDAGRTLALDVQGKITRGEMTVSQGEAWIASNAKTRDQMNIAQSIMREMQDAQRREAAKVSGAFIERFEQAPGRATMLAIQKDKAFQSMESEARASLLKYMRQEVEQADDRYRARRNEQYRTPEAFMRFEEVLAAPDFATKTRQEIYALRTELGPELTAKLLSEHKSAQSAVGKAMSEAGRFKINPTLLNEALPLSLRKATTETEKQQLAAFRGVVESALIEWKTANPGKLPSDDEQRDIVRSANAEYIVANKLLDFGETKAKAYELKPMPADFRQAAREEFARKGLGRPTEAQLLALWAKQKEAR